MLTPQPIATSYDKEPKTHYIIKGAFAILDADGTLLYKNNRFSDIFPDAVIKTAFFNPDIAKEIESEDRQYGSFVFESESPFFAIPCDTEEKKYIFLYPLSDAIFDILDIKGQSTKATFRESSLPCTNDYCVPSALISECMRKATAIKQYFHSSHPLSERSHYLVGSLIDGWHREYTSQTPTACGCTINIDIGTLQTKTVKTSAEGFSAMMTAICDHLLEDGAESIVIKARKIDTGILLTASADTKTSFGTMVTSGSLTSMISNPEVASTQAITAFGAAKCANCTLEYRRDVFSKESFTADFRVIDIGTLGFKTAIPFEKIRIGMSFARLVFEE